METLQCQPPRLLHSLLLLCLLCSSFLPTTHALYFYMSSTSPKCFYEDLPKHTLVVGHFKAEQYDPVASAYGASPDLNIQITVDETFDNDHRVVSQKASGGGKFTFTAADAGEHKLCFTPSHATAHAWLTGGLPTGGVKLTLDLAIGETSAIDAADKGKIQGIVQKIKDLNARLQDIRREQVYQREREAEFRDLSESTNARVVRWSLMQLVVLGVTCAWQLSHLRAFFIKQKLT